MKTNVINCDRYIEVDTNPIKIRFTVTCCEGKGNLLIYVLKGTGNSRNSA